MQPSATLVLLTVNAHETDAVLDAFADEGDAPAQKTIDGVTYNLLGAHGGMSVVHTIAEMGAGGVGASQQRTREAIAHWQPKAVIAVGIAFGVDETKQKVGDVLVATQLQQYDIGRIGGDGTVTPSGDKPHSSDVLCNRFRQTDAVQRRTSSDWPTVCFGLVLSGQTLVDNLDFRESLKTLHPGTIGGEMEGTGLYVSATAAKIDWVVVKAICDWGHNKNQPDKEAWQKLAARNAARVVKSAIRTGHLYPGEHGGVGGCESRSASVRGDGERDADYQAIFAFRADISQIDHYAPDRLIGREAELAFLSEAWARVCRDESPRARVIVLVALGGEGKTSLVAKWVTHLAGKDWPSCEVAFAWSFYSQGAQDRMVASSDLFLRKALTFFGNAHTADIEEGAFEKGKRLAELIGNRRALLILDGLEPLQYAPTSPQRGALKDQGIGALLRGLAARSRGLCVVTTRYSIPDLRGYRQTTAPEKELLRLSPAAGIQMLESFGVHGPQHEFEAAVEDVKGHALTLHVLGTYLHEAHGGDIRRRDFVRLHEVKVDEPGGHACRVMDAYVRGLAPCGFRAWWGALFDGVNRDSRQQGERAVALLRLLGLFDRPATADCLGALRQAPAIRNLTQALVGMSEEQWNVLLCRVEATKLLTVHRSSTGALQALDAHPLLREYFAEELRTEHAAAWRAGHKRLYQHLCATTRDVPRPTLNDLEPLWQAVRHGCRAGLQEEAFLEVYHGRIQRGRKHDAVLRLGAVGSALEVVAGFFEQPWSRISSSLSEDIQSFLLHEAASLLQGLGRLAEALEPMRASLDIDISQKVWTGAAISASTLSALELTLGEVAAAVEDAELSVAYAGRGGDGFHLLANRTVLANALHQAGRRAEANEHFCLAEASQAKRQPRYPLLYSFQGFRYCDLLLSAAERAAWTQYAKLSLARLSDPAPDGLARGASVDIALQACSDVAKRASQTLALDKHFASSVLDVALGHLTLGRAAVYAWILDPVARLSADSDVSAAVDGIRRSGQQDQLPLGLLTRAWLRRLDGRCTGPESAQSDLDEAWEIAQVGPMPLFLADIYLYRARLLQAVTPYPWSSDADGRSYGPKDDVAAARQLIEKHGYWRRKEELEDVAEAAKHW